jgi:hypothetical protein
MAEPGEQLRRLLDGFPAGGETPRLALLDFDVVMRVPDPALARWLTDLYAPMAATGTARRVLTLSAHGGIWSVHLDATRVLSTPAPSIAFSYLLWEANRQAIDATTDRVLVHASAAELDGGAIVLPGPMGAGKSTLVAALVRAGLGYLTDEVVALDPATGVIAPYAKYLSLDPSFGTLMPTPPDSVRAFIGDQILVPPAALRSDALGAPARPRLVVAPRYERGATTVVEPVRPAEALSMLAQHAFHIERDGQRTLDVLAQVVESSSCYRMVSGNLEDATAALLELVASVSSSTRGQSVAS